MLPEVVPLSTNRREVAVAKKNVTLVFTIMNAIPSVKTSDIRWYYAANSPVGRPDFTAAEFEDITDLMNRTSVSTLTYSTDRLSLTVDNIVQAIGDVTETDQGRYFLSATNPAGENSDYIDVFVKGNQRISTSFTFQNTYTY